MLAMVSTMPSAPTLTPLKVGTGELPPLCPISAATGPSCLEAGSLPPPVLSAERITHRRCDRRPLHCACYCFSGTVIGLPLSATMKARTLAGSVRLALAETACNVPGMAMRRRAAAGRDVERDHDDFAAGKFRHRLLQQRRDFSGGRLLLRDGGHQCARAQHHDQRYRGLERAAWCAHGCLLSSFAMCAARMPDKVRSLQARGKTPSIASRAFR